ncbi:hypothetical protein H6G65_00010 [Microcystis elabens FACHB-917]|nr:hypothetical protein [Microcystis elabens FACHB-917]
MNASTYADQDLSAVAATFTLNVTTATGAVLDDVKLATADDITIGAGSATIDASTTDEVALAAKTTVNDGTTLTINNYVNTDLSGLSNQGTGSIVVNTTTGAVLDETKLADATSVVLGAEATGAASAIDGIGTNGGNINLNNQTLSVSSYTTENLSGIPSAGTLNVTTLDGAVLDATKLATADSVTLVGTNTATAADADALGSRLGGTATLNITTDTITANTDLSDLGSGLILQFGGDTTAAVNGATLTVRQDQVSGYTISGTGTVAAAGTAGADTFDASGITATTNFISLAGADSVTIAPSELGNVDVIDGGSDTDTLIFSTAATVVDAAFTNVTSVEILQLANGTNSVSLGSEAEQAGITTVTGSTGDDTFNLLYGNTGLTFNAGSGSDTLSYSADSATQSITLSSVSSGTASGTVSNGGTDSFTGLEAIVGGSGSADSITSTSVGEALIITGANAGTIDGFAFSGVESVNLGVGNDTGIINTGGSLSGNVDFGSGSDTLSYAGNNNVITVSLNSATSTAAAGATGITGITSGFETLIGGSGDTDTLNASSGVTTLLVASGGVTTLDTSLTVSAFETINLGASNDSATFSGAFSGTVDLGDGGDTATINDGGSVTSLVGGAGSDTLNLDGANNSITITGTGAGTTAGTTGGTTTFSGFDTVNGQGGTDAFTVDKASTSTITIDGGDGTDSLSVASSDTAANSLTISGTGSGVLGSVTFAGIESIALGSGGDTASVTTGSLSGNLNLGDGSNSLTIIGGTSSIGSYTGGTGNDNVALSGGDVAGAIDLGEGTNTLLISSTSSTVGGAVTFGSGTADTLSYAGYGNAVSVTLSGISSNTGTTSGGATGFSGIVSGFENLTGSSNTDSLVASAADNTLILTGANKGTVDGLNFSSFENVDSAAGNDTVQFTSGDSLSGTLSGGDGIDTLDYSAYGSAVVVNLATDTATATGGISGFETVLGSSGNDTITASTSGDVNLQGNGSNDTFKFTVAGLTSGDTIAGGDGSDRIVFTDAGTINDAQFTNVSSVESLTLTGASTISAGTEASEAGIATINTGNGATTVNSTLAGYDLTVNATSLGDGNSLTLTGNAATNDFTVTGLNGSVLASGTSGTLTINTADAADNGISISTGTNTTTITASGGGDIVTVDADAMADNTTLDINGSATFSVSNLEANTDASGTSGNVNLAYTDVSDNAALITTGTGATTVSGTTSGDTLTINATSLAQNTTLTASGDAQQVVTNLVGDISATALTGTLTVTTADAADNGISISTGTNTTTITASGGGDIVTVDADAMADNTTLDINGSATFSVSNLEANTDASGSSGALSITFSNITDDEATLLSGSGNVVVAGGDVSDTVTVTGLTTNNQTFNAQDSTSNFNITAGAGNQTITGSNTGNDTIDGGSDYDTLSYVGGNTIDLTITAFDAQAGGSTGQGTDTFSNIENLIGSSGIDVLRGKEAENDEIATVNAANVGTFADVSNTGSFDFSSFEQFDFNAGNDVLAITGNGSLSGSADGGAGIDRLDYSAYAAASVTVDLNTGTATAIAGDLIGTTGDSSFEDVYGSTESDTITGDDTANVILGNGGNDTIFGLGGDDTIDGGDGTNGPDGDDLIVAGDGADLILGSAGNDFISGGGYAKEDGTYYAVGDQSIDTLSYIGRIEGLDLSLTGTDEGTVQADAGSSLTVSTLTNTYSSAIGQQLITVPTNQVAADWTDMYGDIQNLVLTNQNDIVRFDVSDVNTGSINAAGGSLDTLDYSSFDADSPVLVNLSGSAYSFDFDNNKSIDTTIGEITIVNANSATNVMVSEASSQGGAGGVLGFEVVIGGAGDDAIVGNNEGNLLVGNAGNDRIAGGTGSDTIYGGDGDDYIKPGDGIDYVYAGAGINTIAITSSDLADDTFFVDRNGINTFELQGDGGTQTTSIAAPSGDWNPGEDGIALLDGGDPVIDSNGVTTYDKIQGSADDDNYEFGSTALKNIDLIDLGAGDDSVGTAASTKGIKVTYDGNTGTDSITLNFTFAQFAKLNASGLYVADVQNYLDNASGTTFSSSQADFTAKNFEAGGVAVITPAVYNALQGDPAALTFNSAFGIRDSTISSGDDVTLAASALTTSTATALSAADIVSAFVQASGVKGSDAISISSGGGITGSSTASQDAVALSRTVDDRADSVLSAYSLGTDRSSFTAGDDITLSLSGTVKADTTAEAAGFVVTANGTVEAAGSRDSSLAAADALDLTITASGLQTVAATNVEGLAIAGLASRAYGIDDANLTDSTSDSVQAGSTLNLLATASSNNRVTAQTVGNEALGTITLVDSGPAATDRFTTSQTGASFPLINGDRVRFSSSNDSVQADRDYYVLNAIPVTGEFQLSSEPDGSPVDVVATGTGTLQAYRPAVATADAISTVTGVELTRTGAGQDGVQAGDALSLQATATDVITATATSVAGDATAGVFRLGGMDGLNLASEVSSVQALVDTVSLAGRGASLNLNATDTATLSAASTEGAALTEANIQVFGSRTSASTAGDDLSLSANAELNLSGSASSTAGSAEARSGAGAGAGVSTAGVSNVLPTASSFSVVTGLADGTQTAGTDLAVQARGATTLNATASTVSGAGTLGSLWTSASGDILATFDLNLDTTTNTPSFVGPQVLAAGQLVQLDAASAAATGLVADTDYAVKLLGFGAVDASDAGATANSITMPTGITYALNDAVRFRLNSTTAPNSGDSRYGLALGTTYYVVNPTATTFQLSATPGGPVIDLTPDSLGPADQLVDADRFQLLTLPSAPGGTYAVAPLTASASGVSLTLPSVANAFAGSREADRTLNSSDNLNLAQVSGISGNGGLRGLIAGAQNAITAMASGVLNAMARNTNGDATASAGLVAEGLSDTAISAGSAGTVNAEASITAVADAATTGDNALVDNALADLTITARGLSASNAANDISIGGAGDVQSTASLSGRSTASTALGDSDALAALKATGLEALSNGFTATIGQQGAIRAAASIGSLAAPLIISALSSAEGDATAQAAAAGIGILGTYDANAPAGFSSLQAGTSQGDISGTASADLQLRATATAGAASVMLADVPGTGRASITGIENMALTAGAGRSAVEASAIGNAGLEAQSVELDATSQGRTAATGLFSSAGDAAPVSLGDNGRIAAIAQQTSFAQSISVNGNASSSLNNTSLGIGNATITISGDGSLDARALSQLDSRSQSVAGAASA